MPPKGKAAPGKKPRAAPKAAAGHQLAAALPEGEVLTDILKKTWRIGKTVGCGGFGLIYLASQGDAKQQDYVIKVEPHGNGPLFCEQSFYQRTCKQDMIAAWMSARKLRGLGIPRYVSSGQYERGGKDKCRFLVMERFGSDLQKIWEGQSKRFSRRTVAQLAVSLTDCLEYLHSKGYAHADIKASNLLLGYKPGTEQQVYLVDYGLASRFLVDGRRAEYKEDPRKAHDGTIEFTSRDAHKGVGASPRADLEILGYNLVQWLCGRLPWEDRLTDPSYVHNSKMKHMADIPAFLRACFKGESAPVEIEAFVNYAASLKYDDTPDYNKVRQIFTQAAKKHGFTLDGKLSFTPLKRRSSPVKQPAKRKSSPVKQPHGKLSFTPIKRESSPVKQSAKRKSSTSPAKKPTNVAHISRATGHRQTEVIDVSG